ncbi:hypothetical protein [Otoolea muris]|uniref:hypothetical protein n=1 Tax=Otoolea muris TaxID=2941515 RepID=UPI00203B2D9F|nr:hypothetical protein [Otoolea muris]
MFKKNGKKAAAIVAAAMAIQVLCPFNAFAKNVTRVSDVFDAEYYADSYPDLKEAFGYNERALYRHYMTFGLKEGRNGSKVLNVVAYRNAYPDLQAAFGDKWDAYVDHYFTFGKSEGRTAGVR